MTGTGEKFKLKKFLAKWTGISFLKQKFRKWRAKRAVQDQNWSKNNISSTLPLAQISSSDEISSQNSLFFRTYNTGRSISRVDSGVFCSIDDRSSKSLDESGVSSSFVFRILGNGTEGCRGGGETSVTTTTTTDTTATTNNTVGSDTISIAMTPSASSPYVVQRTIGTGSFSKVKLAIDTRTGEKVAIKMIPTQELVAIPRLQKTLLREIDILRTIRHPNIVEFRQVILLPRDTIGIVMNYIPGTELFHYVADRTRLCESETSQILRQILQALCHLHELGIVHRDLKLENIIVEAGPRGPKATLLDFGLARVRRRETLLSTRCGSEEYAAPEVIMGEPYDGRAADLWSLGVVMYACLIGSLPFNPDNRRPRSLAEKIIAVEYRSPENLISPTAVNLIRGLLVREPQNRLTIDSLLFHPWFNQHYRSTSV